LPLGRLLLFLVALLASADAAAGQRERGLSTDALAALHKHVDAVGGAEALADAGDLEVRGRFETVGFDVAHRTLVRRAPFAVREESRDADGRLVRVHITDLHHAWRLHDPAPNESGSGGPHGHALRFGEAVPLMLRAWTWRVLLDPLAAASSGELAAPFVMPQAPFFGEDMGAGRESLTLPVGGPLGLTPNLWFDAEDGRWFGWQWGPGLSGSMQRLRAGRWERHGDLTLPALLLDFDERSLIAVRTVEEVRTGLEHDPALFAGDPAPRAAEPVEVPLEICPGNLPGAAHLLIGGVRVAGQGPWWATLDTGSNRLVVHPGLADGLELPVLGPTLVHVLAGEAEGNMRWLDEVSLGGARWLQRVAVGFPPMRFLSQPTQHQPSLIVGTDLLAGHSPVIDLAGGRLLLRGAAPTTLAGLAAQEARGTDDEATSQPAAAPLVAEAPLFPVDETTTSRSVELRIGDASVRALLDTGSHFTLRLSAAGLRALGLPTGRQAWLERGAVSYETVGLNGRRLPDLVARLDELVLPAVDARDGSPLDVVWRQPLVIVSSADDEADEPSAFAAILGTGALLPFARVGLDFTRGRLELLPGPRVTLGASGGSGSRAAGEPGDPGNPSPTEAERVRLVIPPPGEYLGMLLRPAEDDSALPHLVEVVPGLPADRAGLAVDDALLRIDGVDCAGVPLTELWPRLWLQDRDRVRLVVLREGQTIDVELP
jgi:hypothetical protein